MENWNGIFKETLAKINESSKKPRLLLHSCCAPCSSYVLEKIGSIFDMTLFFYNPNISPKEEFDFREKELLRLLKEMGLPFSVVSPPYDPAEFFDIAKGLEHLPEGGERCEKCYRLRLSATAKYAAENGFDYFTTTLSISPYKNADWLNMIGRELSVEYSVPYLFSDFKKENGYKRSIELSKEYGLYRQNYCGCVYSKAEAEKHR